MWHSLLTYGWPPHKSSSVHTWTYSKLEHFTWIDSSRYCNVHHRLSVTKKSMSRKLLQAWNKWLLNAKREDNALGSVSQSVRWHLFVCQSVRLSVCLAHCLTYNLGCQCLCVCNQGDFVDNFADAVDWLLIWLRSMIVAGGLTPTSSQFMLLSLLFSTFYLIGKEKIYIYL